MGFLDLFTHSKIKEPQVVKDVDMSELEKLNSLLGKVGDDQKDIVENQMKASMIGLDGEKRVMYELKHLSNHVLFFTMLRCLINLLNNLRWISLFLLETVALF